MALGDKLHLVRVVLKGRKAQHYDIWVNEPSAVRLLAKKRDKAGRLNLDDYDKIIANKDILKVEMIK